MAANTNRKTARSIRKDHAQREPAGRFAAGGSGVERTAVSAGAVTGSRLGESQFAGWRVHSVSPLLSIRYVWQSSCSFGLPLWPNLQRIFQRQKACWWRLESSHIPHYTPHRVQDCAKGRYRLYAWAAVSACALPFHLPCYRRLLRKKEAKNS